VGIDEGRREYETLALDDAVLVRVEIRPQLGNRAVVYESLVSSVLLYNVLSHDACRTRAVTGALCAGPYLPAWLGKPRDYSEVQLRTMIRDTEARLQPFWSAVCAKAPKPAGDDDVCPME
jgi:hypothetical protein